MGLPADDVSLLSPGEDVLIDIDDKEPLIPVQVGQALCHGRDRGFDTFSRGSFCVVTACPLLSLLCRCTLLAWTT